MKDRTQELWLRSNQQESNGRNYDRERAAGGGPGAGTPAERTSLLDPFFEEIEKLQQELHSLRADIDRVQKIHSFLLNNKEPDKKIIQDQRNELDQLNSRISRTSIAIKNELRKLQSSNTESGVKNLTATEMRIRETQLSFVQKWFVDLMTDHSTSQSDYNDLYRRLLRTQMEVIGIRKTDEEFDRILSDPASDIFTDGLLQKTASARQALAEVTARHEIILQLEKSIQEVHDLFMQMATMVESQGDMIDVIERNVVKAGESATTGRKELHEAREKQSAARKKKFICYVIIAVAITIFVVSLITGVL